jgi:hypothetical protein
MSRYSRMRDNRCNSTSVRYTQYSYNPAVHLVARKPLVHISGTLQPMELVFGKSGKPLLKPVGQRRRVAYYRQFQRWKIDVARVPEAPHVARFGLDHSTGRAKRRSFRRDQPLPSSARSVHLGASDGSGSHERQNEGKSVRLQWMTDLNGAR